jgi:hypothetical protein
MLKDPRWQKKRLEILQRDGFKCVNCEAKEKTLHVHHLRYLKGKKPWEYDGGDLQTLCVDCHAEETKTDQRLRDLIGAADSFEKTFMIGFLEAQKAWSESRALTVGMNGEAFGIAASVGLGSPFYCRAKDILDSAHPDGSVDIDNLVLRFHP